MAGQDDLMLDAAFAYVRERATRLNICSAEPSTFAEATSTYMLAQSGELTSTHFTLAAGDVNGRKMTIPAKSGMTVSNAGTSAYVALTGSSGSTLLLWTKCSSQALVTVNTVNTSAWDDEIADAAT